MSCRLLDVNLIIIGDGPEAEVLLQRRLQAGGRACLLYTSRRPQLPQFRWRGDRTENKEEPEVEEDADTEPMFEEETFIWQPPRCDQREPCAAVRRLRRRFHCAQIGLIRIGPDIIELEAEQRYELIKDRKGNPTGVRVFRAEANIDGDVEGNVVWQVSGAVVLADAVATDISENSWPSLGRTRAWAQGVDVQVHWQDAKPVMISHHGPVLSSAIWFIGCMVLFYVPSAYFEPKLEPGHFAWWRLLAPLILMVLPLQMHPMLARAALGFRPARRVALPVQAVAVAVYFLGQIPPMYVLGGYYHLPYFAGWILVMEIWVALELYLMYCLHRDKNSAIEPCKHPGVKHRDFKRQVLWTLMLSWSRTVIQITMWLITLIYGYVEPLNSYVAGLWLIASTAAAELVLVGTTQVLYDRMVWRPRVDPTSEVAVQGDQMESPSCLIGFAHGICESVRLTNLLAAAVYSSSWQWSWLGTIAMTFVGNIVQRQGIHTYLALLVLPKRFWKLIRPSCVMFMHRHARFYCGYYRFLGVLGFIAVNATAREVMPERPRELLFNGQTLALAFVLFMMEVLEDIVVGFNILPVDPWRDRMKHLYEELHPLHMKQLLCKDSRGLSSDLPPLRLHGARYLSTGVSRLLIDTGALKFMMFLWVRLGIGYTFGICPEPIPPGLRVLDAIAWTTPWRCS